MSESPDPSIRHDHYPTARTETIYPSRERGPATQSASQPWAHQQQWLPPPTYMPYPLGGIPYGAGYVPYLLPPQLVPSRWDDYNPFNEEETERKRKNGKELVHSSQPAISMAPWGPYPGPQGPFLGGDFGTKKAAKNVHHRDQRSVTNVQPEIRINRDVDGVLTPDSGDLTVHLDLDLQEDLDDHLDELNRLSRIGHFSHAKDFFNENLQLHIDNPYVLVHYAELLIQQGDFRGVTLLKDDVIYRHDSESPVTIEQVILRINWELMQILAKSHTLDTLIGATTIFDEAADVLTDIAKARRDTSLSSTEIKIIALMSHLTGHPALKSKWLRYGRNVLNALPSPMEKLYQSLLREGRVWDFHDLIVYMPTIEDVKAIAYHMTGHELIPSLQKMVSDWSDSIHGFDSPTTLALLDTLTYIMLEPLSISEKECIEILKICLPLAKSIMENDPQNLKSRPFLRLLLSKSRFAETASRDAVASLENHLKSSQGVFYSYDIAALPIYIPVGSEVPDWVVEDQPPELRDAVKLVLRSAKDLGDLQTEVIALKESIRLSGNPKDEFRTLCEIQRSSQGDMKAYASSLASKYLVSNFPEERETLAVDISRLLSRVSSTDYLDSSQEFVLNMLLYRLEGRSSSTIQHMLERSHIDYLNLDTHLQQEISRKMPVFKTGSDNRSQSADRTQRATTVVRPHARRNAEQSKGKRARASSARRSKDRNQTVTDSPKKEVTSALAKPPKHATIAQQQPSQPPPLTPYSPTPAAPAPVREVGNDDLQVAEINENALRKQVEAEFTLKFQKEEEYEHRQREERLAVLEALKREVDAIRKEAVEQAEKKARVEAEQRALNLKWEKERNEAEEMEHQKYLEAQAADTELLRSAREAVRRKHEELDERVRKVR
ncbi:hypothetical protein F5Y18DRAFT_339021 [Xylariaceae sp. FL1019]|nr:hypothetical protein F5Y18DRAFT_339021 [Xylariaceae sp. FL1019]